MSCTFNDREDMIEKYLLKELPEAEMDAFEEHYLSCNECIAELESTKQMLELIKNEGEELFPEFQNSEKLKEKGISNAEIGSLLESFKFIFSPQRISYGFAAVVVLLLLFTLYESNNDEIPDERIVTNEIEINHSTDSVDENNLSNENVSTEPVQELYAANFHESGDMEYLINQNYRSDGSIVIISPQSGITANEEIKFNWKTDSDERLLLKILNNVEDVLYKLTPANNHYRFNIVKRNLDPGLYYWKLESAEELLHVGKFYVKQ